VFYSTPVATPGPLAFTGAVPTFPTPGYAPRVHTTALNLPTYVLPHQPEGQSYSSHAQPYHRQPHMQAQTPPIYSSAFNSRTGDHATLPSNAAVESQAPQPPPPSATPHHVNGGQLLAVASVTSKTQPHKIGLMALTGALITFPSVAAEVERLLASREFSAWVHLTDDGEPQSLSSTLPSLVADFGDRLLLVVTQWGIKTVPRISGIVTCGPKSLGDDTWRLGAFFDSAHKVPLTLCVLQLAVRFWFALRQKWPRVLHWRMPKDSIESRRIAETALVFHAKQAEHVRHPGTTAHLLFTSITFRERNIGRTTSFPTAGLAQPRDDGLDVRNGLTADENKLKGNVDCDIQIRNADKEKTFFEATFENPKWTQKFLMDLATWGLGSAQWVKSSHETQHALFDGILTGPWHGNVLFAADLPLSCRGFQHLPPAGRATLLGETLYGLLDRVAINSATAGKLANGNVDTEHDDALDNAMAQAHAPTLYDQPSSPPSAEPLSINGITPSGMAPRPAPIVPIA
jgi:hypothetical protein